MTDISPSSPASWPTEPPAAVGLYFVVTTISGPALATRYDDGRWWLHGDYEYDDARLPVLRDRDEVVDAGWRFFPTPITPSSLAPQADAIAAALASLDALVEECAPEHVGAGVIQYKRSVHPGEVRAIADRLRAASAEEGA